MELSPDNITAFQRLYETRTGVRLTESEARKKALVFLALVAVIYRLDAPSAAVPGYIRKHYSNGDAAITD